MHPPKIEQQVTFLFCKDLEKTSVFYEGVLGFDLVLDQGSCRIYRVTGSGFVGFCLRESQLAEKTGVIFTLVTQEVDQWYQYLMDHGVEIEKPPAKNLIYNIYHLFFRDPDGYLIEIQQFLDPAWPV